MVGPNSRKFGRATGQMKKPNGNKCNAQGGRQARLVERLASIPRARARGAEAERQRQRVCPMRILAKVVVDQPVDPCRRALDLDDGRVTAAR